jgi:hypothetical protein
VLIATNDTPYLAATNLLLINVRNHPPSVCDKLPSDKSSNANKHAVSETSLRVSTCPRTICLETISTFDARSTAIVGACLYRSRFVVLSFHAPVHPFPGPKVSASLNCKAANCLRGSTEY